MTSRLKIGYRVVVLDGAHKGKHGTIASRSGGVAIVRFDGGGSAQIASSSLRKVEG